MITRFDEDLTPSYELNKQETEELIETGYVVVDGMCIVMMDNEITIYKEFEDYDSLKLFRN